MSRKTIFSTIGVIVLGALGSGLWELAKPLLSWAWFGMLTVATLGLDSLRDGIYADAAANLGRPANLIAVYQGLAWVVMLTGVAVISYIRLSFRPQRTVLGRLWFLTLFFGANVMLVSMLRTGYVAQLASYYGKLETISAPFISDAELKRVRSEYVQITKRQQYIDLVEKLQVVIRKNGAEAPVRSFF
jgi:hypothetical protein